MSCDSSIAICGMNAICGIFIRICAIFSFDTQLPVYHPHPVFHECIQFYLCEILATSGCSIVVIAYRRIAVDGGPMAEIMAKIANFELPRGCILAPQTLLCPVLHRQGEEIGGVTGVITMAPKGIIDGSPH